MQSGALSSVGRAILATFARLGFLRTDEAALRTTGLAHPFAKAADKRVLIRHVVRS